MHQTFQFCTKMIEWCRKCTKTLWYQKLRYNPNKNRNFDTKLRFFFYPQKTLNKGISQKKEKFLRDFIYVYWEEILPQDTFSQFTIKLNSVNKCTAFDLKFRQSVNIVLVFIFGNILNINRQITVGIHQVASFVRRRLWQHFSQSHVFPLKFFYFIVLQEGLSKSIKLPRPF